MEGPVAPQTEPTVRIDALETFVELLSRVEADPSSDAFYSRLCEATCRLADMDRAVIFRYDGARRRGRPAGALGEAVGPFAPPQGGGAEGGGGGGSPRAGGRIGGPARPAAGGGGRGRQPPPRP